jgi:hypothetical protein
VNFIEWLYERLHEQGIWIRIDFSPERFLDKKKPDSIVRVVVPHRLPDARSSIGIDFSPEKLVHKKRQLFSYLLI